MSCGFNQMPYEIPPSNPGGSGEVNTASNLGAGTGVFGSKVGVDLQFKSLKAGTGISISNTATEITINSTNTGLQYWTETAPTDFSEFTPNTADTHKGVRIKTKNGGRIDIGISNTTSGFYSIAIGQSNTATNGGVVVAVGGTATNTGAGVFAGSGCNATGQNSVTIGGADLSTSAKFSISAGGVSNSATGERSGNLGGNTNVANGMNSVTLGGDGLIANSYTETVIGSYNKPIVAAAPTSFNLSDPVFIIGNGLNSSTTSNALVVYKSGAVEFNEAFTFPTTDGTTNQVLQTDGAGNVSWATVSGGGEVNTASNLGLGSQLFKQKTGVDLEFRTLTGGTGVNLTQNANDVLIDINDIGTAWDEVIVKTAGQNFLDGAAAADVTEITIDLEAGQLYDFKFDVWAKAFGDGDSSSTNYQVLYTGTFVTGNYIDYNSTTTSFPINEVFSNKLLHFTPSTQPSLTPIVGKIKTITAGTLKITVAYNDGVTGNGVTVMDNSTISYKKLQTFTNLQPSVGEANTGLSLGAGEDVFYQKSGVALQFKSLLAGTGISLSSTANDITINSTGTGEVNTASNLGAGTGVFGAKVGVDLQFKSLVAGTGISITNTANDITINSSAGLSYWTESEYTYLTKTGTKFTPSSVNANQSVVFQPKGTGFISAHQPDGTATGGDNRGNYSVDLQMASRLSAEYVASGNYSVVPGGESNEASGEHSTVSGGKWNSVTAQYSTISGGFGNNCGGKGTFVGGGTTNSAIGNYTVIVGGELNQQGGSSGLVTHCFIGGGYSNTLNGNSTRYAIIVGGNDNYIQSSDCTFIGGGENNTINSTTGWSTIVGGKSNIINASGHYNFVGGGLSDQIQGASSYGFVGGGQSNIIHDSDHSAILGGYDNQILAGANNVIMLGNYQRADIGADYSVALGLKAYARRYAELVWNTGDLDIYENGSSWVQVKGKTIGASATELYLGGTSANRLTIRDGSTMLVKYHWVRRNATDDTVTTSGEQFAIVDRGVGAGTTNIIATYGDTARYGNDPGFVAGVDDLVISADTVNGTLKFTATGRASKDMLWFAFIQLIEITE